MSYQEPDSEHVKYAARNGRLSPRDHAEVRRRTTHSEGRYTPVEVRGITDAHETAQRHGLSITDRIAATYHHIRDAFASHFKPGPNTSPDERAILKDALAIEGEVSQIAKLH